MKHKLTLLSAFLTALFVSTPVYAAGGDVWYNAKLKASSMLDTLGQFALGGGVIIVVVVGLIMSIVAVFTLLMMLKR